MATKHAARNVAATFYEHDALTGDKKPAGSRYRVDVGEDAIEVRVVPGGVEVYFVARTERRLVVMPEISNVLRVLCVDLDTPRE